MEFFVNSQKIDITLEGERTIGDVLNGFEKEFEANGATTAGIVLDGKKVSAEEFDGIFGEEIEKHERLELSIITLSEVRDELFAESEVGKVFAQKIKDIPVQLQSGKDREASMLIATLAEFIGKLFSTARLTDYFPDDFSELRKDNALGKFFEEITPVLNDLQQAMEAKDTVLIGDLAEYEISPRLEEVAERLSKV